MDAPDLRTGDLRYSLKSSRVVPDAVGTGTAEHYAVSAALRREMISYYGSHLTHYGAVYREYSLPSENATGGVDRFRVFDVEYALDGVRFREDDVGPDEMMLSPSDFGPRFRHDAEFGSEARFLTLVGQIADTRSPTAPGVYRIGLWDQRFADFSELISVCPDEDTERLRDLGLPPGDLAVLGRMNTGGSYIGLALYWSSRGSLAWEHVCDLEPVDEEGRMRALSAKQWRSISRVIGYSPGSTR